MVLLIKPTRIHFLLKVGGNCRKQKRNNIRLLNAKDVIIIIPKFIFSVKSKQLVASAKESPFYVADHIPQQKPGKLKDITKNIDNSVNRGFEKTYGLSFAEAQTKVPELKLSRRKDQNERKAERRQNYRKIKTVIEDEWKKSHHRKVIICYCIQHFHVPLL